MAFEIIELRIQPSNISQLISCNCFHILFAWALKDS